MRAQAFSIGAALMFALPVAAADTKIGAVTLSTPWARATPGGATTAAVYLTLSVAGAEGDRLVKAASPRAERAELHAAAEQAGVMRMTALQALDLSPGKPVTLAAGGMHIMLVGLKDPLFAGDRLPLSLTFARAGAVELMIPVIALGAKPPGDAERIPDPHAEH